VLKDMYFSLGTLGAPLTFSLEIPLVFLPSFFSAPFFSFSFGLIIFLFLLLARFSSS